MNINKHVNTIMMSAQPIPSVEEAKKILRASRLAQHKENIRKALTSGKDSELAVACGSFASLFTTKSKPKVK